MLVRYTYLVARKEVVEMESEINLVEVGRELRFYAKEVYGTTMFYPVDYKLELFRLTGQRTLTARTMSALEGLGFQLKEVLNPERGR